MQFVLALFEAHLLLHEASSPSGGILVLAGKLSDLPVRDGVDCVRSEQAPQLSQKILFNNENADIVNEALERDLCVVSNNSFSCHSFHAQHTL
jgi:hypothetical protein